MIVTRCIVNNQHYLISYSRVALTLQ